MEKVRFVGLDVHKESIAIAVADEGIPAPHVVGEIPNELGRLLKELRRLQKAGALRCCYEAGPTGFILARELEARGIACMVVAPSLIPKQVGSRVKTDTRDAVKLARFLRSGDLTAVHVPSAATEAMRDLERSRQDAKKAERVSRHQLAKFLLRQGRRYEGKTWNEAHRLWIRAQKFDHEAHNRVLVDYVHAVEDAGARVERLTKDITELVESWSHKPLVKALQALRGIRLLSAVTIVAELDELSRFARPSQLMSYVGLVPSEHSSGESVRRGSITRTGNKNVRTALVESAWAYRFRPAKGPDLRRRSEGVSPEVCAIAWKAQARLHGRYTRLMARGKNKQRVVTAVARELVAFIWDIARQPRLLTA
ncbi:MAG: IS110 family transposase [Polyangiales bacterium]